MINNFDGRIDKKLKFIYWFAFYNPDSPSVRYRAQYPLDYLKNNYGISFYLVIPSYKTSRILKFIWAYFSALLFRKPNSLIVIQRLNSNFIYANLLRLLIKIQKTNTVYDLDDAIYLENPPRTIFYYIKNCSALSVGSNELYKSLSKFNKNIHINTSPTPNLDISKKHKNSVLTIGWIGEFGGGHKESLTRYFFPALKELPFKIKLVLLGVVDASEYEFLTGYFKNVDSVLLEMPQDIPWKDERYIQECIAEFDIGVATLLDTEIQRSKSGFKAKQYLNNGVPVLSPDIPENNCFVKHGYNGFLCPAPSDYRDRIIEISEMSQERYAALSSNCRQSIRHFDLAKYCSDFQSIYKNAVPMDLGR